MSDLHEATFRWPHPEAKDVIVTGSFDHWSASVHLPKQGAGFEGKVKVPWGQKITYKYVVDGRWTTTDDQPTELDPLGNLNNVYNAPAKPPTPKVEAPAPAPTPTPAPVPAKEAEVAKEPEASSIAAGTLGAVNGAVGTVTEAAKTIVEAIAPGTAVAPTSTPSPPEVKAPAEEAPAPETKSETVVEPVVAQARPAPVESESYEPSPADQLRVGTFGSFSREQVLAAPSDEVLPIVPIPFVPLYEEAKVEDEPTTTTPEVPTTVPEPDVSASQPLETTLVEGAATSETAVVADAPAPETVPAPAPVVAEETSTHGPAINGSSPNGSAATGEANTDVASTSEAKTNGVSTNGTSTNGTSHTTPTPATSGSATPSGTAKRMHFPSLGSRRSSVHSSATSTNEFGETKGKNDVGSLKRSAAGERQKRNSFFGKLKGIFHHDSPESKK